VEVRVSDDNLLINLQVDWDKARFSL